MGNLIEHTTGGQQNEFPLYINQCWKSFCNNKTTIKLNVHLLTTQYQSFCKMLLDATNSQYFLDSLKNNLIDFAFFAKVFPRCTEIACFGTDPPSSAFNGQGFLYFDSL